MGRSRIRSRLGLLHNTDPKRYFKSGEKNFFTEKLAISIKKVLKKIPSSGGNCCHKIINMNSAGIHHLLLLPLSLLIMKTTEN